MRERYIITTVPRNPALEYGVRVPAVWDRRLQRVVHSYRRGQETLAAAMAAKLTGEVTA